MRQAPLYRRLRESELYTPGGSLTRACTKDLGARIVKDGWLAAHSRDYRLTETGELFIGLNVNSV
jgi:hypothetical protein